MFSISWSCGDCVPAEMSCGWGDCKKLILLTRWRTRSEPTGVRSRNCTPCSHVFEAASPVEAATYTLQKTHRGTPGPAGIRVFFGREREGGRHGLFFLKIPVGTESLFHN